MNEMGDEKVEFIIITVCVVTIILVLGTVWHFPFIEYFRRIYYYMCTITTQNYSPSESDQDADGRYVPSSAAKEPEGMFSAEGMQRDNKTLPGVQFV